MTLMANIKNLLSTNLTQTKQQHKQTRNESIYKQKYQCRSFEKPKIFLQ